MPNNPVEKEVFDLLKAVLANPANKFSEVDVNDTMKKLEEMVGTTIKIGTRH